ncbi:ABC transporter ATP-binding protein [Luteimonas aquatica]|uniref:ABC transporter ATP-binding protein n=1 Tax=Luteimonas aquatica TaxID=450364 RepID=UPI001F5AE2CA|nr:ABC transporter ATP-binding protein [Luteimonas aquatica]
MTQASIHVERLALSVPIFLQRERMARGWAKMFLGATLDPPERRLVKLLDDVSFKVREGDRVAILGRNGAGKSTLLRVLNGVYAPTSGHVRVVGSCQALLNMSLGFNSEATVRENIFLRGTAMGMKGSALREHIEPILDFSGLHEKSNHRLRTLSAGQKMRLGFAISTSFQHDVILMDEWVGAGDAEFMAKATERMKSRVAGSRIVMLASHSVGLLRDVCNKGIVLERGRLMYVGEIVPALQYYHDLLAGLRSQPVEAVEEPQASSQAYGYIEHIRLESGVVHVGGWCIGAAGELQNALVMDAHGVRMPADHFERVKRPDVVRHLGLSEEDCGFRARFSLPGVRSLSEIGPDVQLLAGESADRAGGSLKFADAVIEALQGHRQRDAHRT